MKAQISRLLTGLMLVAGISLLSPAIADDAHHPEQQTKAAAAKPDQAIQKMQSNTKLMQNQLEKMAKSKDPKVREQLMMEHMKTMQENANMAQGMMSNQQGGCPMMGGGMMGMMGKGGMGMMGGGMGQGGMGGDAMMSRMQMMEKRMDMMQMMMEQMNKSTGMPVPPASK